MIFVKGRLIRKAWSLIGHGPEGSAVFRNPPAQHFKPPQEMDIPAFAHGGRGEPLPGEWKTGPHGEQHYDTPVGSFQHGIDAVASRLGRFFGTHGIDAKPTDVINRAIEQFNKTHSNQEKHSLPNFDNMAWRKIRAGVLPPGRGSRESAIRPTRTKNGTIVTAYTNKNYQETPVGRFIESYAVPFHEQMQHVLEDDYKVPKELWKDMSFVKYPYIYAHQTAPQGYIQTNHQQHPGQVSQDQMARAPDGYFGEQTPVFTHSVAHHLPDIMYYPNLKDNMQKPGKQPTGLYRAAEEAINDAMSKGIESIPDVPATINVGTMASPEMVQRPLREILQNPDLRQSLIKDMAHVPAMMFLFGRSGQGDFKKHFDRLMGLYGADEEGLSYDEHSKYFKPGAGGGKGKHLSAARLMALAHKSGVDDDDPERSKFGTHAITNEELGAFDVNYNEGLMGQVDRFRGIIEALADHQADAQGHPVKMALGDINTQPMQGLDLHGYPEEGMDVSLEPHMDAYLHDLHDYAPSDGMPIPPSELPVPPESTSATTVEKPVTSPPSTGGTPPQRVGVVPQGPPATPLRPQFQELRPQIGNLDAQRFREMMTAGGGGRVSEAPSPELTPVEARAQQSLSDPRQQLLSQYMKAEDAHLPVMDRVMKALERMQQEEAGFDGIKINSNLNSPHALAKHVGLTASEVVTINQTMGDWHNIAKSYNVNAKVVKVIKTNMK